MGGFCAECLDHQADTERIRAERLSAGEREREAERELKVQEGFRALGALIAGLSTEPPSAATRTCKTCGGMFEGHRLRKRCSACYGLPTMPKRQYVREPSPKPEHEDDPRHRERVLRIRARERMAARAESVEPPVPVVEMDAIPETRAQLLSEETRKRGDGMIAQAPWSWNQRRRSRRYDGLRSWSAR
jgi:hypothetical protein